MEEYTIGGLIDPRTHRIMFVFKSVDPEATVRHHNEHPTEEWKERTELKGTPKRDWLQDLHNNGLEAAWVILETVQTDAAGAKAARNRHIAEQFARNPNLTNKRNRVLKTQAAGEA